MQYCSECGVKHNFTTGVIFLNDRNNYGWNCAESIIEERVIKNFKYESKLNKPLLVYE